MISNTYEPLALSSLRNAGVFQLPATTAQPEIEVKWQTLYFWSFRDSFDKTQKSWSVCAVKLRKMKSDRRVHSGHSKYWVSHEIQSLYRQIIPREQPRLERGRAASLTHELQGAPTFQAFLRHWGWKAEFKQNSRLRYWEPLDMCILLQFQVLHPQVSK